MRRKGTFIGPKREGGEDWLLFQDVEDLSLYQALLTPPGKDLRVNDECILFLDQDGGNVLSWERVAD